jgi:hypothetical protein
VLVSFGCLFISTRSLGVSGKASRLDGIEQDICRGEHWSRWVAHGIVFLTTNTIKLFRRYDFEVLNPAAPVITIPHTIFIVKDMNVRITERQR